MLCGGAPLTAQNTPLLTHTYIHPLNKQNNKQNKQNKLEARDLTGRPVTDPGPWWWERTFEALALRDDQVPLLLENNRLLLARLHDVDAARQGAIGRAATRPGDADVQSELADRLGAFLRCTAALRALHTMVNLRCVV